MTEQTCKAHACLQNQLAIIFSPGGAQAWGALMDDGKPVSYLGAPGPAQQSALRDVLQE